MTGKRRIIKAHEIPDEHIEQVNVMCRTEWALPREIRKVVYAIPNGGKRDKIVGARMKAEGVKRGMPDICVATGRRGYRSMYIEMKRQDGGRLSSHQREMIEALRDQGNYVVVANGCAEAWKALEEYLSWGDPI
jgi:hypothetical protein